MAHKSVRRSSPDLHRPSGRRHRSSSVDRPTMSVQASTKPDLNLVLCGSDDALKASVSKCFRGKTLSMSHQTEFSSECVMEEEMIHGRLISLVELPALNQLSEEEVMCQTLHCVSLCDPGVHVFLLIIPDAPLTDEDKAEIENIQKIFHSRQHFILLFMTRLSVEGQVTDLVKSRPESQRLINLCGGQYRVMGLNEPENSRQIPELLDYIENMNTEPYLLQTYVKAQENRARHETEKKYREELKRLENKINGLKQTIQSEGSGSEADDLESLRIVMIGRTGNGKSATGNTILGRDEFESKARSDSVTAVCQKRVGEVAGRSVAVVDTPGLFDTTLTNDQVTEEIVKCVSLSAPGPHVFVIVLRVDRFTKEETDTVHLIKKIFGPKAAQFSIVLFTRGDDLEDESIQDYVKESKSAELKKLIRDCDNRYLVFNNREKQDRSQVIQLLNMIEEVKNTNEGRYFTNSMFEEAEMSIKKRMEQILKEREREIQARNEALKAKYEIEMKNLMKRLEEDKKRADEDKKKMEDQLREKEENLRKEFMRTEQKKQEIEKEKQSEEEKLRSEYHQIIEEMKREMENQRLQYEKQKEREEEDRKREEKYRQDQEKMKNEQERIIAELKMQQEEEIKKKDLEEKRRNEEEEEERQRWKRKIKEAENDRKEIQEEIKRQQREWEDEKKRQMREREEEERKRKEKHEEQLREKQEELEKMRKRFEREREEERQNKENEREKQRREREEKEREYEEKRRDIKRHYELMEQERKEEWERRKREDEERREEERKRWKEMIEDLRQEREEEMKRREREEKEKERKEQKESEEMKQKHEKEIKAVEKKHKDEARKQAEEFNESTKRKNLHVLELTEMIKEHQEQDELLEKLHQHLKAQDGEDIKELLQKVEKLKNKPGCAIQ